MAAPSRVYESIVDLIADPEKRDMILAISKAEQNAKTTKNADVKVRRTDETILED